MKVRVAGHKTLGNMRIDLLRDANILQNIVGLLFDRGGGHPRDSLLGIFVIKIVVSHKHE